MFLGQLCPLGGAFTTSPAAKKVVLFLRWPCRVHSSQPLARSSPFLNFWTSFRGIQRDMGLPHHRWPEWKDPKMIFFLEKNLLCKRDKVFISNKAHFWTFELILEIYTAILQANITTSVNKGIHADSFLFARYIETGVVLPVSEKGKLATHPDSGVSDSLFSSSSSQLRPNTCVYIYLGMWKLTI